LLFLSVLGLLRSTPQTYSRKVERYGLTAGWVAPPAVWNLRQTRALLRERTTMGAGCKAGRGVSSGRVVDFFKVVSRYAWVGTGSGVSRS
jgi:hypothetical protein